MSQSLPRKSVAEALRWAAIHLQRQETREVEIPDLNGWFVVLAGKVLNIFRPNGKRAGQVQVDHRLRAQIKHTGVEVACETSWFKTLIEQVVQIVSRCIQKDLRRARRGERDKARQARGGRRGRPYATA
ncbi:MAG: hypothetical protein H6619_05895 [Deltaproteobacteria bacterium]|nr:hypothetical protein [Deltaproteobacteria bacterium]